MRKGKESHENHGNNGGGVFISGEKMGIGTPKCVEPPSRAGKKQVAD